MSHPIALALCVHHKPWLAMSTLVTALVQDEQQFDICFLHNRGDGEVHRASYERYDQLVATDGGNFHLSPYDDTVRAVCALRSDRVSAVEYENDQALDSGAFFKFIRDGRWSGYEHVLFAGEGTLFARPGTLAAVRRFARDTPAHFIQSGHEQRRLPKELFLNYCTRRDDASAMERFHDEMTRDAFAMFCRDDQFRTLFDQWSSSLTAETQHHVPQIPPTTALGRRLRRSLAQRLGAPHEPLVGRMPGVTRFLRETPYRIDRLCSDVAIQMGHESRWASAIGGTPVNGSNAAVRSGDTWFHRVPGPEWFGCTPVLFLSRTFLERLARRLDQWRMWDVLDLPFAASALEVIWGFMPAWLGVDKWFTDGFHRVRKDFVTYRREDYAPDLASYVNRYHRGRVSVDWRGELLKIRATAPGLTWMRDVLPAEYF